MHLTLPQPTYQQLVFFARQLPITERIQLIRDILAEPIEAQTDNVQQKHPQGETLYGMLAGQGPVPSDDDIRAARREVWGDVFQ